MIKRAKTDEREGLCAPVCGRECVLGRSNVFSFIDDGHTYVRSAKCYVQGGAFPNRATSERSAVGGRLMWRGESYHAGAELLEQTGALGATQCRGRPSWSYALHAAAEQKWDAAAGVWHWTTLLTSHMCGETLGSQNQIILYDQTKPTRCTVTNR